MTPEEALGVLTAEVESIIKERDEARAALAAAERVIEVVADAVARAAREDADTDDLLSSIDDIRTAIANRAGSL